MPRRSAGRGNVCVNGAPLIDEALSELENLFGESGSIGVGMVVRATEGLIVEPSGTSPRVLFGPATRRTLRS